MKLIVADNFKMNSDLPKPALKDEDKKKFENYLKFIEKTIPKIIPNEENSSLFILYFDKIYTIDINW